MPGLLPRALQWVKPSPPRAPGLYGVVMKHLTFADKNFLVGDNLADAIIEYATALGERHTADSIDINAIGADGDEVSATLFLSTGVPLVAETTTSTLPEPNNDETVAYIEARLALFISPALVEPGHVFDSHDTTVFEEWMDTQE
jgi:hypothetical protein